MPPTINHTATYEVISRSTNTWTPDILDYHQLSTAPLVPVSDTTLRQSILNAATIFSTMPVDISSVEIAQLGFIGFNSKNFKIIHNGSTLFLKQLSGWRYRDPDFSRGIVELLNVAADKGAAVIKPILATNGSAVITGQEGQQWLGFPWVNHTYYNGEADQAYELGSQLARLHTTLQMCQNEPRLSFMVNRASNVKLTGIYSELPNYNYVSTLINAAKTSSADPREQNLRQVLLETEESLLRTAQLIDTEISLATLNDMPRQLVHADLTHRNILKTSSDIVIVDFEKLVALPYLYDLGAAAVSTFLLLRPTGLDPRNSISALIKAYFDNADQQIGQATKIHIFACIYCLHLALVNIKNIFIDRKFLGASTSERHIRDVGYVLDAAQIFCV